MSGNSRKGDLAKSSDYGFDLENLSSKGSYPQPSRQVARLEQVVLCSDPDLTELFVKSVTDEVNGFSSENTPPVEYEDMLALFYYAVLAKLAYVTHLPGNVLRLQDGTAIRGDDGRDIRVRYQSDLWVLPGAYVPVLGRIGKIEGVHPVVYHPVITDNIVVNAALAVNDPEFTSSPGFPTRLERVEKTLLRLERRGLLISRGLPKGREGDPDIMTAVMYERELFFRRPVVEGLLAAIAGSISPNPVDWQDADESTKAFVMETFIGRSAFGTVYMPEDIVLAVREMARDFTRER